MANEIAILGIDLGKNSCSVVGLTAGGAVIKRRRLQPENLSMFTQDLRDCDGGVLRCAPSRPCLHSTGA